MEHRPNGAAAMPCHLLNALQYHVPSLFFSCYGWPTDRRQGSQAVNTEDNDLLASTNAFARQFGCRTIRSDEGPHELRDARDDRVLDEIADLRAFAIYNGVKIARAMMAASLDKDRS